jgi:hypothetical protein
MEAREVGLAVNHCQQELLVWDVQGRISEKALQL